MNLSKRLIAVPAVALAAGLGLAACGTTRQPVSHAAAPAPKIVINNNNNNSVRVSAPSPSPSPVYVPPPVYVAPAPSDPWSVFSAYVNDVNDGDASAAWALLGPSEQATWNNNYSAHASWVYDTSFTNLNEVSESGDTVTVTFNLSNSAGTNVPYTDTVTVQNGIITSNNSTQN